MYKFEENTTFVGVSELRDSTYGVVKEAQKNKVVLTRRNKPVGVLLSYEEYQRIEELLELLEDYSLGYLAKERMKKKNAKWIPLEEVMKELGIK